MLRAAALTLSPGIFISRSHISMVRNVIISGAMVASFKAPSVVVPRVVVCIVPTVMVGLDPNGSVTPPVSWPAVAGLRRP